MASAGSTDPDGDSLTYAWDLSGDGVFDDAVGPSADWTYQQPGTYDVAAEGD
ncbi:MAG: PKD domain-containing protein [Microthrixaceae bacterium]